MTNPFGDAPVEGAAGNPFGDIAVETPGMVSAFKRGRQATKMGNAALELDAATRELAELEPKISAGDKNAIARKEEIHKYMLDSTGRMEGAAIQAGAFPKSPEYEEFQNADGWKDSFKKFAKAPVTITSEVMAESLGGQSDTLPLTIAAGVAAGPVGLAATAGAASAKQEYGSGTLELLMQKGIDLNNPDAVAKAMNSPEFKAEQANKLKKAAVVGTVDAATAGMAGVKIGASQAKNIPAQMGIQAGGGAGGEAAGSVAAGEEVNPSAVIAEAVGEVPGAGVDVATATFRKMRNESLLHAAKAKEEEAMTGLAPAQKDTVKQATGEVAAKPKLTPIQAKLFGAAADLGVDPQTALVVASIETGGTFNPTLKNKNSSAHGLFQMIDGTWEAVGGGDRDDIDTQITNGIKNLRVVQTAMQRELGRVPTAEETYMGHLFGPHGAAVLVKAEPMDPQGSILDAIKKYDSKNAEAIVRNNGLLDPNGKPMTVEQGLNKVRGWFVRHSNRLGVNGELNAKVNASVDADAAPHPAGQSVEELMDEVDATLAELEMKPPTPGEIAEAKNEEHTILDASIDKYNEAPEVRAEKEAQEGFFTEETEELEELGGTPDPVEPVLSRELAGARPRYGIGRDMYEIEFDSDLDKAAYIIRNETKRSTKDAEYLKFVMDNSGMTEQEAREYGKSVSDRLRGLVANDIADKRAKKEQGPFTGKIRLEREPAYQSDTGVSLDERKSSDHTPNPNDNIAIRDTPIIAGPEGSIGAPLSQYHIGPGEVVAVGVDSDVAPAEYMEAVRDTIQEVISKYAPTARVAVSFKSGETGAVAAYKPTSILGATKVRASSNATGLYQINMRTAKIVGQPSQNTTTGKKITYAAYHEVGHLIADHEFTKGMSPQTLAKFRAGPQESPNIYFDESDFQGLTPEQAAVLQEYNELKRKVLNDPRFTVGQFLDSWLSPWKLGHGWGKKQGKVSFLKKYYGESSAQMMRMPAANVALKMHFDGKANVLSPHEYFAEQMARHAFSSGMAEKSPLAVKFFGDVLAKLRDFFRKLKKESVIKPGIAFDAWLDSLTATTKEHNDSVQNPAVPAEEKAPTSKRPAKPRIKPKAKIATPTVPETEPLLPAPVDTPAKMVEEISTAVSPEIAWGRQILANDKGMKSLKKTLPKKYAQLQELVEKGRIEDFKEQAAYYLDDDSVDQMRWDTDNPEDMEWRDLEHNVIRVLPQRTGVKRWLGNGLRRLADAKYLVMTMRQMAWANPEVAGLQSIEMLMTAYKAYKAKLEFKGLEAAQAWAKLPKEQHGKLEEAMRQEHYAGEHVFELEIVNKTYRFVPGEKAAAYAAAHDIDEGTMKVWLDVKNAHLQHMNSLQNVLRQKIRTRYAGRPKTMGVKLAELHQTFEAIRAEPFIPQTRFGEFALQVTEPAPDGEHVLHVEFFETKAMRDEAAAKLKKHIGPGRKLKPVHFEGSHHILRTLPPRLLSTVAQEMDLTAQEKAELREMLSQDTRDPRIRRYSRQLSQITGANKSLLRNFADFMWHDSNNVAKLAYREHFNKGLRMVAQDMAEAAEGGDFPKHDRLSNIYEFSSKYVDHFMNPADEWQKVRAFVVVKQLWGNIKTAVANLSSLAQVWAVASREAGIVSGTGAVGGAALKQLSDSMSRTYQRVLRQPVEGGQVLTPDQRWALEMAKNDGILDESFAAQLAQFANAGTLSRMNFEQGDSFVKKAIWLGMLPQHAVENYARRVTLQSMFDIYLRQGRTKEEAYSRAKKDTYLLQGDNTILNRPAFMRGKASAFLIYYGYLQNMMWMMSGGQERGRNMRRAIESGEATTIDEARDKFNRVTMGGETLKMWMAYGAMGGLMGLPGAEDLDKILELVSTKMFGHRFSLKEHAYKLAATIAEEASAIGVDINPRSIVHGNMSDISMFGLLPGVDISSSIGLGQALPGTGGMDKLGARGGAGDVVLGMMGPLGGVVKQFNDVFSDDNGMLEKMGLIAPNTVTGMAKAIYEHNVGARYSSGAKVTVDRQTGEVRDLTTGETLARLMGFQPSVITANKELHWMQKDAQNYWMARRNGLLTQAWEAKLSGDREAIADARKAIDEFNESARPELKLSAKDVNVSMKIRKKGMKKDEELKARQRRYQELYGEIESSVTGRD